MNERRKYKVVQWATGSVGATALRAIIEHPHLELAGVLVFDTEKEGLDAGELCGIVIEGRPSYELNLFGTDEHGRNYYALEAATAFRIVNRIPDVCEAAAGIVSPIDFGLERNPGLVRS